jgi:hypothetical protein
VSRVGAATGVSVSSLAVSLEAGGGAVRVRGPVGVSGGHGVVN